MGPMRGSADRMQTGLIFSAIGLVFSVMARSGVLRVTLVEYFHIPVPWLYIYPLLIHFIGFLCVCYGGVTVLGCRGLPRYAFYRGAVSLLFIVVAARYFLSVILSYVPPM